MGGDHIGFGVEVHRRGYALVATVGGLVGAVAFDVNLVKAQDGLVPTSCDRDCEPAATTYGWGLGACLLVLAIALVLIILWRGEPFFRHEKSG